MIRVALATSIIGLALFLFVFYTTDYSLMVQAIIALNIVAFVVFGTDKALAIHGARRIPEMTFFLLALAGATPGILIGMHLFRHKIRKPSFQLIIVALLVAQILVIQMYQES